MIGSLTWFCTIAALFVGFLQLPQWLVLPLAVAAAWGMSHYDPVVGWWSWVKSIVVALVFLSIFEWVARIASQYMTGQL